MVDTGVLVRNWLLGQSVITSLLGSNAGQSVYAAPDLPKNFDPSLGPGIQVHVTGGPPSHPEITTVVDHRMQIRVWAGVDQYDAARNVYGLVRDLMHGACGIDLTPNGFVIRCLEVTPGQDVTDPDTGWATVIGFFQLMAR